MDQELGAGHKETAMNLRDFILITLLIFATAGCEKNSILPVDLRVGPLLENPISFGDRTPQFSWKLPAGVGVKSQSAYRIVCDSQPEDLHDNPGLWDSGWVQSDQTLFIDYEGKPITSGDRVYWSVQFKDQDGRASKWGEPAYFEMGLLDQDDWSAEWIFRNCPEPKPSEKLEIVKAIYGALDSDEKQRIDVTEVLRKKIKNNGLRIRVNNSLAGDPAPGHVKQVKVDYIVNEKKTSVTVKENNILLIPLREESAPSPYLRREFSVNGNVEKARLYATAYGLTELYLNGNRIGDDYFIPGWTEYKKRLHVHTFDITNAIQQGQNTIGAILGIGWHPWSLGFRTKSNPNGDKQELLCQLSITYADGSRQIISSDKSWKAANGPILSSTIYDGERYDARKELGNWSSPGYNDKNWQAVQARSIDEGVALDPLPNPPVRKIEELTPITVNEPAPDRHVFDLGQNMVGWARISVPGHPGQKITMRFAEMLNDDGTIYTENLRSAKATDEYICKGSGTETWEPRFTFHGFRYIELSGFPKGTKPQKQWVTGVVLHNEMRPTGTFTSSHKKLNKLQSNIRWGQKGNFLAVPTDCPQRDERLGWTGDAQVFTSTANYNFDTLAFFAKWCQDMRDSQFSNGGIPYVIPNVLGQGAGSGWHDAAVVVPWEVYKSFGYRRILEDNYDMMKRSVSFYDKSDHTKDFIYNGDSFGDWLQPYQLSKGNRGDIPRDLIGTAYFAHDADLVSRIADILAKPDDVAEYQTLYRSVSSAFAKKFFDGNGKLTTRHETQTGYLLALAFDLLPEEQRQPAFDNLVRLITKEASGSLRTGFLGTPLINPTLTRFDRNDLAYSVLFNDRYPGWFFSIDQGATTMWERWNSYTKADGFGDRGMNSFNHYAYGAIGEWMYETIAGLSAAQPGYKHLLIAPEPGGDLTEASATLETPYGIAKSTWVRTPGKLSINITVPPNTTATVYVPAGKIADVTESGQPAIGTEGVTFLHMENKKAVFKVATGDYRFISRNYQCN